MVDPYGGNMPFDPSSLSVKAASKKLDGLSLEDLKSLHEKELDGKHRSSLMAAISRHMDLLKEAEEEHPVVVAVAIEEKEPEVASLVIGIDAYMKLRFRERIRFRSIGGSKFERIA